MWLYYTSCLAFFNLHCKQKKGKRILSYLLLKNKIQVVYIQRKQVIMKEKLEHYTCLTCLKNVETKMGMLCCMFYSKGTWNFQVSVWSLNYVF